MISLDEMKQYLRVDYEDDDSLIESFIKHAQSYIDSCCGESYKKYSDKVDLANLLIKRMVKDMYDNRGSYLENKKTPDRMTDTILELLSNCGD
ncbi:head-tail connector protein [Clostridium perfringens]|uniref:head-tail connector protein n=1 Tax=Clostridium perfringens TaxID=1502 RepID=UPI0032DA3D16